MKVLVTGATGFIGREIVSELSGKNFEVLTLGRSAKPVSHQFEKVKWFQIDITDQNNWFELEKTANLDAIIHSAGLAHQFGDTKKEDFDAVNVAGTENVLNVGVKLKIKHFILIGSTAVYGNQKSAGAANSKRFSISEDAPLKPLTLYAESKLASEKICRSVCEENKIPLTIFRLAPVIGEDNVGNVSRLIDAIDNNRFVWIGDGENLKSLIYKKDVARACVKLLETKENGTEIFNLAAEPVRMKDFVVQIAERLNKKIFPIQIPASIPRTVFDLNAKLFSLKKINKISETVEKWLADDVYAADKIARTYDFRPTTTIEEAIEKQIERYQVTKNKIK